MRKILLLIALFIALSSCDKDFSKEMMIDLIIAVSPSNENFYVAHKSMDCPRLKSEQYVLYIIHNSKFDPYDAHCCPICLSKSEIKDLFSE